MLLAAGLMLGLLEVLARLVLTGGCTDDGRPFQHNRAVILRSCTEKSHGDSS